MFSDLKKWWKKFYTKYEDYIESFLEFIIVYIVSNLPIIFIVLFEVMKTDGASFNYDTITGIIKVHIKSGEIFIYIATLIAPAFYIMVRYNRARKHIPWFTLFLFFPVVILSVCILFFIMNRTNQIGNVALVDTWSLTMYILSLIYWYASLVYSKKITSYPYGEEKTGAQAIIDGLKS